METAQRKRDVHDLVGLVGHEEGLASQEGFVGEEDGPDLWDTGLVACLVTVDTVECFCEGLAGQEGFVGQEDGPNLWDRGLVACSVTVDTAECFCEWVNHEKWSSESGIGLWGGRVVPGGGGA